ncbi:class I SAM-dependent methyltransferase [Haloarchaeobius sp. DFWS5]|uniref:class I SAM-dependent methyltransferase n=1 Tax=Haloarchaeobius sp. DFWS5 TaxID=3446114 RepID=UPI003EBC9165
MPHVPNLLERLYILRANRAPGAIYDLLGAGTLKSVALAGDLGVFEELERSPARPGELTDRLDCHADSLALLCDFLVKTGYLDYDGETLSLSGLSERWLVGEVRLIDWFRFWDRVVFPFWDDTAADVLRTGEPEQTIYEWLGEREDRWPVAQRGFEATARLGLPSVLDTVDTTGVDRLLDVGGGHGRYTIGFCEQNSTTTATIVDDPAALAVARENVAAAGLSDRVETRGADILSDDLAGDATAAGDGYDLALVFNVVHGFDPAENRQLFDRVADALAPGGRIAVMEQFEGSGPIATARTMNAFIGLNYRVLLGGRVYPYETVADWLIDAGFEALERSDLRRAPGVSLVSARLP